MQKLSTERFNFKKLHEVDGKELYQVKISNMYAILENLHDDVDINRDTIQENVKISSKESLGYYKQNQHKLQF
jgi:hypothetical protein